MASAAEILELVGGGSLIELDNGWRLVAVRIAGDEVLELVLNGVAANRDELLGYLMRDELLTSFAIDPHLTINVYAEGRFQ